MNKISVVVPAYNAEKKIENCIQSILNQTYDNLEIVVVNDGSTDGTLDILKGLFNKDSRIKIVDIKNGGVSHARNTGIDNATGDYITFVDSDDTIEPGMYEYLINLIDKYGVDIAHCSYANIDKYGNRRVVGDTGREILQNHDEALKCLVSGRLFIGGLCNKLYKIKLFDDVRLDETIKFNEDILINYELFDKAKTSVYSDRALYDYYANDESATHSSDPVIANKQCMYVSELIYQKSKGKIYESDASKRLAYTAMVLYRAYLYSDSVSKAEKNELKHRLREFDANNLYVGKNEKINVYMMSHMPLFYKLFYKFYDKIRVKKLDPEQ